MSPWIPRALLALAAIGVGYAIVAISVGEGGPQAVEIDLFTDVRAVPAAEFQHDVVDPLIEEYVRTGRAQINLRHYSFGRSGVTEAAIAAEAAGDQGHQWQYAELVMRNLPEQGEVDEEFLNEVAEVTPGLDKEEWDVAFSEELQKQEEDPDYEAAVEADDKLALELKLPAEPALVLTGPGGTETLDATPSLAEAEAALERVEVSPP
jgi:protein-disulfide isomerase